MQKFLAYIKQEWEITVLAVTTTVVLIAAAVWVCTFVLDKDGTVVQPSALPQPPEYFQTDNTDYLNYYAVNKAKVNPFLFKHKVPPTPAPPPPKEQPKGGAKEQPKQQSTAASKTPDKPAPKQPDKQPDKPAPPSPPPPPPVIVTLSYDGFYQGISGVPQAIFTYVKTQDKKKLETDSLTEKANNKFKTFFKLYSVSQEKIIVRFNENPAELDNDENPDKDNELPKDSATIVFGTSKDFILPETK